MDLKEIGRDSVDWIHPAQNMNKWWAVVSTAKNFWFYKIRVLLTAKLSFSQGLRTMELVTTANITLRLDVLG